VGSANLATNPCSLYINLTHPRFFHVSGARLGGCVWGRPLATHHARVRAAWSQSLKKLIFGGSIVVRAGVAPASGRPVRKAGSVCAKVELEVGGCCPGQMGEKHWGVRACTLWKRGHCHSASQSRRSGPGPKRKGGGRGESVATAQQGKHLARGTAERASGTRSLSPCLEQLQHAIATREVSPLSQLRRCLRRAARCFEQDSSSIDSGGCCCLGLAQPHHVPLPSHAMSLTAKTAVACNVVGAQLVPAHGPAGVRLIGPFLHVVSTVWQLAAASAPDTAQGPTPSFSLPLDTCLKNYLRHAG
jgi:hypothetical protein